MRQDFIRPRLVLLTTLLPDGETGVAAMRAALGGGDVASVIIDAAGRDADSFQRFAEGLVPMIQEAGAAAIVADDTRCAGRVKADGLHVTGGVIYLSVVALRVLSGFYDRKGTYETVEIAGLYWHFVDLVWVFIFALFYLW